MHFIVIQPGPGAAWTRAEVTAGPLLPSSIFGLRKRPSLLTNCLGILSFGFWKTPVSQASQTATGKLPRVPAAPRQLWRRAWGEGAVEGAPRPPCLGQGPGVGARLGSLTVNTSCSGLYSLGFVWSRKCWKKNVEQPHGERKKKIIGPKGLRREPSGLCLASLVPWRRQERSKAETQLQSETLGLHSSHPLKCLVAALRNCCSKVCFQHRNKQCESMTPFPRNGTQKCNTNRKLSTVVL